MDVRSLGQPDGAALKAMRESQGIQLYELADWLDIKPEMLKKIEAGKRWMMPEAIKKLFELVGRDGLLHGPKRIITPEEAS